MSNTGRFQKGHHWRKPQPWWDRAWLEAEYIDKGKSASEIASECRVTENAIYFWIKKHAIPTRDMVTIRSIKHWGLRGEVNGMFGKRGVLNPNWRGGLTPARQRVYARAEWKALLKALKKRDPSCRLCGAESNLVVHHIDPFSNAPLLALDIGNVIRLCEPCHIKLRGKELRWRKRLFNLIHRKEVKV